MDILAEKRDGAGNGEGRMCLVYPGLLLLLSRVARAVANR